MERRAAAAASHEVAGQPSPHSIVYCCFCFGPGWWFHFCSLQKKPLTPAVASTAIANETASPKREISLMSWSRALRFAFSPRNCESFFKHKRGRQESAASNSLFRGPRHRTPSTAAPSFARSDLATPLPQTACPPCAPSPPPRQARRAAPHSVYQLLSYLKRRRSEPARKAAKQIQTQAASLISLASLPPRRPLAARRGRLIRTMKYAHLQRDCPVMVLHAK